MAAAAKAMMPGLMEDVKAKQIRFPKHWDENQLKQQVLTALLACHTESGGYDANACVAQLEERFGLEPEAAESKKRAAAEAADGEGDGDEEEEEEEEGGEEGETKKKKKRAKKADKPKLTETFGNEHNKGMAIAIKEIGDEYFRLQDRMKGGVYSKAARALREAENAITSGKEGMKLKGIGKGVGAMIDEFLSTGMIQKLEKLRSGESV